MAILWAGGEDIDFPNGSSLYATTVSNFFRSGYARCGVGANVGAGSWSIPLGVGVTSAWLSVYVGHSSSGTTGIKFAGLVGSSSGNNSGVWFGTAISGTNPSNRVAIFTYNGSTLTQLAVGITDVYPGSTSIGHKIDMHITNYGSSSTVNLYIDGSLYATYSGSTSVSGVSSLDAVGVWCNGGNLAAGSEFIFADQDTRAISYKISPPNGAGTTDSWTGAYTDINEITINDATVVVTNSTGQDEQFTVTGPPAGAFAVLAVKEVARATVTSGSTPTGIKLGINSGGTIDPGTAQTLNASWQTVERLMQTNPVTGVAFTTADLSTLQMNLRSN